MPVLTEIAVRNLPEGIHYDAKLANFGIRVGKTRKTWIVQSKEKRTKITLGHYPAMSLSEARKAAIAALIGPERQLTRISYPDAVRRFLALSKWRPHSKRVLASSLKHFTWTKSLDKVTRSDVMRALDKIDGPSARHHALKDIKTFFNWCIPQYLDTSPCIGIKSAPQPSRARVLSNDEIRVLWHAVDGTFGTIFKVLLLTGQRKSEIGKLRAEWVRGDEIILPVEVVKNKREHAFPIGPAALALLPETKKGLLFSASTGDVPYNGYTHHLKQLRKKTGITDFTIHDLRRTFSTKMAELGVPIHVTEKILNHVSGSHSGVQAIYNRYSYKSEMRDAVLLYESHLSELVGSEPPTTISSPS